MKPLGPCFTILTQKVPGVWDSSLLHSTGTLRSGRKGQYTPQLSSYLERMQDVVLELEWKKAAQRAGPTVPPVLCVLVLGPNPCRFALVFRGAALEALGRHT